MEEHTKNYAHSSIRTGKARKWDSRTSRNVITVRIVDYRCYDAIVWKIARHVARPSYRDCSPELQTEATRWKTRNIEKRRLPFPHLRPFSPSRFRGSINYVLLSKSQPSLHRKNHSGFQVYPQGFKLSVRYNFPEILLGSILGDVFYTIHVALGCFRRCVLFFHQEYFYPICFL